MLNVEGRKEGGRAGRLLAYVSEDGGIGGVGGDGGGGGDGDGVGGGAIDGLSGVLS